MLNDAASPRPFRNLAGFRTINFAASCNRGSADIVRAKGRQSPTGGTLNFPNHASPRLAPHKRTASRTLVEARCPPHISAMTFPELARRAEVVVLAAQQKLPPEVREAAGAVPVCYEAVPNAEILAEGWEPDILGLFVGHEHGGELAGDFQNLPPQILLFLENIWDFAEGDEAVYREEVRLTYLHELGHYLGWDEDEVARRGLE